MKILLFGDVHGRINHLLALARRIYRIEGQQITKIIQVGDMGAFPYIDRLDTATIEFAKNDKSELDFAIFMNPNVENRHLIAELRILLNQSIQFIRGNHEDHNWLDSLEKENNESIPIPIIPNNILEYVPDFYITDYHGVKIGFLSGKEDYSNRFKTFIENKIKLDLLITHYPPYGVSIGFKGQIQGSNYVTEVIKTKQPRYHFFGHLHQTLGPFQIGKTISIGLSLLIQPLRNNPAQDLLPGSIGLYDTESRTFSFIFEDWFSLYKRNMSLKEMIEIDI